MLDGLLREHLKLNSCKSTPFYMVHSTALKRDPIIFDTLPLFKSSKLDL